MYSVVAEQKYDRGGGGGGGGLAWETAKQPIIRAKCHVRRSNIGGAKAPLAPPPPPPSSAALGCTH